MAPRRAEREGSTLLAEASDPARRASDYHPTRENPTEEISYPRVACERVRGRMGSAGFGIEFGDQPT